MNNKKFTIVINKSAEEVFNFTLDPKNTSLWVDSISEEVTNETPTKLGTIYRNRGKNRDWSEYMVTEFEKDKKFTLSEQKYGYHVTYTFKPLYGDRSELTYYEWVDNGGQIAQPFTIDILQKLKNIIESR